MASSGYQSYGVRKWKCSLCSRSFYKEHEMDHHMVNDCIHREPAGQDAPFNLRRGSAGSNPLVTQKKKDSTQSTGKQSVLLTWGKELDTCERDVYFFHKSGDMYQLKQGSSDRFECKCELEAGEHEGSLNVGDSGVHEISPFTIKRQTKQLTVVLKILGQKPKSKQENIHTKTDLPQPAVSKQIDKNTAKYKTDTDSLQTKKATEKKDFQKREEEYKQIIAKMDKELQEKKKEIIYRTEEIGNLEIELGRYSQMTQEISDKCDEDKSKYDRFETKLKETKMRLEQKTNELISLQREKQATEENNTVLLEKSKQYEHEISILKLSVDSLYKEHSLLKSELQNKNETSSHTFSTQSSVTEEQIVSLKEHNRKLEDVIIEKDDHVSQLYSELHALQDETTKLKTELEAYKSADCPSSRKEAQPLYGNLPLQRNTDTNISKLRTEIEGLELELTIKTSKCEDLEKRNASLESELEEKHSNVDCLSEFEDLSSQSVYHSLGPTFKQGDLLKFSQSADKNQEKALRKQAEDFDVETRRSRDQISTLQQLVEAKDHQIRILKSNLDDAMKEIESYKLHTQANHVKVQSDQGTIGVEKSLQYSQAAAKHAQTGRYRLTTLLVNQQSSKFYTLNQVEDQKSLLGELVACRARDKSEYVVGTLQVVILPKYKHEQRIAGIEFLDQFGDSNGFYKGVSYFKANYRYAIFLPTNEVYIGYNKQNESLK